MTDGPHGPGAHSARNDASGAPPSWFEFAASLPDAVVVLGPDGVLREANDLFCRLVGHAKEELTGAGQFASCVATESREAYESALAEAQNGHAGGADLTLVTRGRTRLVVNARVCPAPVSVFGPRATLLVMTDVTVQKQLRARLTEAEQRWRSIVENPNYFVVVMDRNYRYTFVNHTAPGLRAEDLIGKSTPFDFVAAEFHAEMKQAYDKVFREGVATSYQVYSPVIDQWTLNILGPIFEGGEVTAISTLVLDVSEGKRAEQAFRGAQRLEMLGVLAGGVAHDFKEMLAPIVGNVRAMLAETERTSPLYARLEEFARGAARASEHMNRLVLFEQSAPDPRESFSVSALAAEVTAKLSESLPYTIELVTRLPEECPGVSGVAWQIRQAIESLCDNACRALASRGGKLTVSVESVSVDGATGARLHMRAGPGVKLVVRDDGPGMPPETSSRAFEPFFSTWKEQGCKGLGLPAVQAVASRHSGAVVLQSARGDGTTVEIYLPADAPVSLGPNVAPPSKAAPRRILCVDDESAVLKLTRRVLERGGHVVVAVTSPVEALARLEAEPTDFDLVVSDYTMPRLTGAELAAKVQAFAPGLPFILVSGFCDPALSLPGNVKAMLQKPVPVDAMLRAVEEAAARK